MDCAMACGDIEEIRRQDATGNRTGLLAVPLIRAKLKKGAEVWMVTVRVNDITDDDLRLVGIPRRHLYKKPIADVQLFLRDVSLFLDN